MKITLSIILGLFLFFSCTEEPIIPDPDVGTLQLVSAKKGGVSLLSNNPEVPSTGEIILTFSAAIDPNTNHEISLSPDQNLSFQNLDLNKIISISTELPLTEGETYQLIIGDGLKGANGETFPGYSTSFQIESPALELISVTVDEKELKKNTRNIDIPLNPTFKLIFSQEVDPEILEKEVVLVGQKNYDFSIAPISSATYELKPNDQFGSLEKINLLLPSSIGEKFQTISFELFSILDTIPKFPIISDDELLTKVQEQTFKYFWDFGHPVSGLARERNTSGETVTSGGSGFGLMAMIVGVERGFITRQEAVERWQKIMNFLENADRFHGVWSHWLNGTTGRVIPFSAQDNGGDLVETAFLVQGMLTVRQYLDANAPEESALIDQITQLYEEVEWNWYTKGGEKILYWHWSPQFEWAINLPIRGHNETQIIYTLAASSPTYPIDKETYINGYTRNGGFQNRNTFYGIQLPTGPGRGGPLFFSHYSYIGMDPRNLQDEYVNYWDQNVAHTLINRQYCIDNPQNYVGYSETCWGLTASDGNTGYSAHDPGNDRGVITPTAAISSIPYTPEESLAAIKHFYYLLGDKLWGPYGFYDAFNPTAGWYADSYLAIDQGPIICMIENFRTGLLWDLYMSAPEVRAGLDKLGITY
ncbi:glucoamylase family protein [Portibacter marinus]|uniref:glucoamylase family protein n=1 Tax=Portibacter marinus TaxID=2898660 RepID=UPI001F3517D2|nr:glucoamylase family protein [Portibacter marinus]